MIQSLARSALATAFTGWGRLPEERRAKSRQARKRREVHRIGEGLDELLDRAIEYWASVEAVQVAQCLFLEWRKEVRMKVVPPTVVTMEVMEMGSSGIISEVIGLIGIHRRPKGRLGLVEQKIIGFRLLTHSHALNFDKAQHLLDKFAPFVQLLHVLVGLLKK